MKDDGGFSIEPTEELPEELRSSNPVEITVRLGSWLNRFVLLPEGAIGDSKEKCTYHYCPDSWLTPRQVLANFNIPIEEVGFATFNEKVIPLESRICEVGILHFYPMIIGG